jgi:hypothetical protein
LRVSQLLGREPLQIEEVFDILRPLARKAVDDQRRRIAIVLLPARPTPVLRTLQSQVGVERIVDGMQTQRLALHLDETAKRLGALAVAIQMMEAEARVQELENFELRGGNADVVDVRGRTQATQRRLELLGSDALASLGALGEIRHVFHGDVQHVEKLPIRRTVGTDVRRIRRHQRMQRIETDDAAAERRGVTNQLAQIAEIAHAPVTRRAQRIELRSDAPCASPSRDDLWLVAMLGCHDQTHLAA